MTTKIIPFLSQLPQADQQNWQSQLHKAAPQFEIVLFDQLSKELYVDVEVAIVANPEPSQLLSFPNLKWVQSLWAGVDNLLSQLPTFSFDIVAMNDPQLANSMSESVVTWTHYLQHKIPLYLAQQRQKIWQQHPIQTNAQTQIGILGLGKLGAASATKLSTLGYAVSGWSRTPKDIQDVTCYSGKDGLKSILQQSHIIISLLPLTPHTTHLLDDSTLSFFASSAALINFSRGAIIDDKALLRGLDTGKLSHAVLDVFDEEPLPQHNSFWSHPKITLLPHISAPTNHQSASKIVANNLEAYFLAGTIPPIVNIKNGY